MFTHILKNQQTVKTVASIAIAFTMVCHSTIARAEEITTGTVTGGESKEVILDKNTNGSSSGDGGTCPLGIPLLCGWW